MIYIVESFRKGSIILQCLQYPHLMLNEVGQARPSLTEAMLPRIVEHLLLHESDQVFNNHTLERFNLV